MDYNCKFCHFDSTKYLNLVYICELSSGTLYLHLDQTLPGRCLYAVKRHVKKLTDLTDEEFITAMKDLRAIAKTITELYHPDNVNFVILGDLATHLHIHIVPKYLSKTEWGTFFTMDREDYTPPSEAEIRQAIRNISISLDTQQEVII